MIHGSFPFQIEKIYLVVRRYALAPEISQGIQQKLLENQPIVLDISRLTIAGPMEIQTGASGYRTVLSMGR